MTKKSDEGVVMETLATFSKDQLLASKLFADQRDLITALLQDGVEYTFNEVEKAIETFLKGEVK